MLGFWFRVYGLGLKVLGIELRVYGLAEDYGFED
jgi:hypothetical protein